MPRNEVCSKAHPPLCRVSADARFAAGERVAGAIESFVLRIVVTPESAKGILVRPPINREIFPPYVRITEELGPAICRRRAKELSPRSFGAIGRLKRRDFLLGDFELPHHKEHASLGASSFILAYDPFALHCRHARLEHRRSLRSSIARGDRKSTRLNS